MHGRHIEPRLREALADTPVVFLQGPRQTGKSTLARALATEGGPRRYVSLDDPVPRAAALADPAGFLAAMEGPVVLDEVRLAPALFRAIKASVDRDRRPGRFLLTRSADTLVLPDLAEALTGRMEVLTLWPLSQAEMAGRPPRLREWAFDDASRWPRARRAAHGDPADRILRGGFPAAPLGILWA